MTSKDSTQDPNYEPLINLSGFDATATNVDHVDLESLVPTNRHHRTGLFNRALKYMTYIAGEGN